MDMQEGGALALDPGTLEFLEISSPHDGVAVDLCLMCFSRFDFRFCDRGRVIYVLLFENVFCPAVWTIIIYRVAETGPELIILILSTSQMLGLKHGPPHLARRCFVLNEMVMCSRLASKS